MSATSTLTTPKAAATADSPLHPSQVLLHFIVTVLGRMFVGASGGDIALARLAARATIDAYAARNDVELISISQIIAYGLAALNSLSRSMDDDLPLALALRLRGNAGALNRAAEHNRQALEKARTADSAPARASSARHAPVPQAAPDPAPEPIDLAEEAAILATLAETQQRATAAQARLHPAKPVPVQPTPAKPVLTVLDQQIQAEWAAAMADVAAEFTANLADLPPAERKEASNRAALLSTCANELLSGSVPADLEGAIGAPLAELRALQAARASASRAA
jgi:hypothetical protein